MMSGIAKRVPSKVAARSMATLATTTTSRAATATATSLARPCGGGRTPPSSAPSPHPRAPPAAAAPPPAPGRPRPPPPARGQRHAAQPGPAGPEHDHVGDQRGEDDGKPGGGRDHTEHGHQAGHGHPDPDRPAEDDHLPVQ